MTVTDLVLETADMRLIQTAQLLEWLVRRHANGDQLEAAWKAVEAARASVHNIRAGL